MRQAGRSLPEYREIRGVGSILEILTDPELSAKITLQPVERHGVDAAVLYSDIVVPLKAFHVDVDIVQGVGPVVSEPVRTKNDLAKLIDKKSDPDFESLNETVSIVSKKAEVPLIGFAGGPFTVACYLVDGRPSKNWSETRKLFITEPELFGQLLDYLCDISFESAKKQIQSGASAIQIFDSWIGSLSRKEYLEIVMPHTALLFRRLAKLNVPLIYFGLGTAEILDLMALSGPDVISVDHQVPLGLAWERISKSWENNNVSEFAIDAVSQHLPKAIQGNLNPLNCLVGWKYLEPLALDVLKEGMALRTGMERESSGNSSAGYIFNLGHGVLPETNPDNLTKIVELIKREGIY